jgi:hypothetical protein
MRHARVDYASLHPSGIGNGSPEYALKLYKAGGATVRGGGLVADPLHGRTRG